MPRLKKASIENRTDGHKHDVAHTDRSDQDYVVSVSNDGVVPESSLGREPKRRKQDESAEFWRKLVSYGSYPHDSKLQSKNRSTKFSRKQQDFGKVKEMYRLCTNPSKNQRTLLIQYPNREPRQHYRDETGQKPSQFRIKPKCGVIEVDIPIDTGEFFDQGKGIEFGGALRKSQILQKGKSYGLAGGLGIGPNREAKGDENGMINEPSKENLLENFDFFNNEGYVMNKITLAGRIIPFSEGDPVHMIATFEGSTCTWTKLDGIVQLRPQFSHLDALNEQGRAAARQERNAEDKARDECAEDVNMIIKDTADNEDVDMYGGMSVTAKLLRTMRDEPWQSLKWVDQSDDASYEMYDTVLVHQDTESTINLISEMSNEQFLDVISCPRVDPISQGKTVMQSLGEASGVEDASSEAEHARISEGDDEGTESDVSDGRCIYEALPKGLHQPDGITERNIERICRIICTAPSRATAKLESKFRKLKDRSQFAFIDPTNKYHAYYQWRLERNRAGDGIPPEYDLGMGDEQGETVRRTV